MSTSIPIEAAFRGPRARDRLRRAGVCLLVATLAWGPLGVMHAQPVARGLPSLGDGLGLSLGAERRIGDGIARELYRDPDYLDDPVLDEYVGGLWQSLLDAARARGELPPEMQDRFAWQVLLGRDRSVNAFALPGGYLGLHLGLIGVTASRDELASVLAHELSHVTQRHVARLIGQQERSTPLLVGAMILGAIAASRNPQAANALMVGGQALAIQNQLNFSRDMEREADRVGHGLLAQAGFAEQGAIGMFEKLQQASRLNDNGSYPYLRSHPLTTERLADMQARQGMTNGNLGAGTPDIEHAMIAARARVLSAPGVDVWRAWVAASDARDLGQQGPDRRAAVLYAAALSARQLGDAPRASALATRLSGLATLPSGAARLARLLQAELALRAGEAARALEWLSIEQPAGRADRSELLLRAQAQRQSRAPAGLADAAGRLRGWLVEHTRDAGAWQALGDILEAQGQGVRALRAQGEAQAARLDLAGAVDRFKAAQALARRGGGDDFEAAIIEVRLRETEARLREQALER